MRTLDKPGIVKPKSFWIAISSLSCVIVFSLSALPQSATWNRATVKVESQPNNLSAANSIEAQRRAFAISLVVSLATDARSYSDLALRPRVLSRAADVLWEADNITARALFVRAWEAAEAGDADESTGNTKDKIPAYAIALRKMSGHDLRVDVLSLASRRDKALGETFLAKLKAENEREAAETKSTGSSPNVFSGPESEAKRLLVAGKLLSEGQVGPARDFAAPALTAVNFRSIGFLSDLRAKDAAAADQIFAALLARTEIDPAADGNTISGLSSYAFTPGFYIVFWTDGHSTWNQPEGPTTPPNLPAPLRERFFQVAANVLLRPQPPPDQDLSSCGRRGKAKIITRLLPLFDQFAPDTATALRAQLAGSAVRNIDTDDPLLNEGIKPEPKAGEALDKMQEQLDRARSSAERDQIYAAAAAALAPSGNKRARELANSIDDSKLRSDVRNYVDFELVKFAVRKKDVADAVQNAKGGELTHTQRSWAYTQAARLLPDSQRERALDLLQEALDEARRIDASDSDRAFALIAIANQMLSDDRTRAWDLLTETVKAANAADDFRADDIQMPKRSMLVTRSGTRFIRLPPEDFSFSHLIRTLALDDLDRSVGLAKDFKHDAPRAAATLAIAKAIIDNPPANTAAINARK